MTSCCLCQIHTNQSLLTVFNIASLFTKSICTSCSLIIFLTYPNISYFYIETLISVKALLTTLIKASIFLWTPMLIEMLYKGSLYLITHFHFTFYCHNSRIPEMEENFTAELSNLSPPSIINFRLKCFAYIIWYILDILKR